jgi:hypothetical protein
VRHPSASRLNSPATPAAPLLLLLLLLGGLSLPALLVSAAGRDDLEPDYLPLVIGNEWVYAIESGGTEVQKVDRELLVRGRPAFAITHRIDGGAPSLEDYWSTEGGDVLYHGFYRHGDFGLLYDPPLLVVDAPLSIGATWSTESDLFLLPDSTYFSTETIDFTVLAEEMITVPAGNFLTYDIEQTIPPQEARRVDRTFIRRWVAADVGMVRFDDLGLHELESYQVVLAVTPTSWGAIKWRERLR